jgi:hypothetical protein
MIKDFIKGHINFILLAIVQGIALFGLICGFAALFMSIWECENRILWMLFFGLPLLIFILWVWFKAIIPWTFVIIDSEHGKYLKDKKSNNTK